MFPFQYLMTKTAAMHFGGPATASSGGHPGGMGGSSSSGGGMGVSGSGGSGGSSGNSGRDVKPHQCQQCLKTFSSNHQLVQHIRVHTEKNPTNVHIVTGGSSNCRMCSSTLDYTPVTIPNVVTRACFNCCPYRGKEQLIWCKFARIYYPNIYWITQDVSF